MRILAIFRLSQYLSMTRIDMISTDEHMMDYILANVRAAAEIGSSTRRARLQVGTRLADASTRSWGWPLEPVRGILQMHIEHVSGWPP